MLQNAEKIQELLTYKDTHAPWFSLDEHQPKAIARRNLKLLMALNSASTLTLAELNQLSANQLNNIISTFATQSKKSTPTSITPTTAAQFFHSKLNQSPYFCDIIPFSESTQQTISKSQDMCLSTSAKQASQSPTEQVHGFQIKEGEAFSSTRYFSDDKKSFARIVAKNGTFTATSQNLNKAQKADLALEMCYQYLLNLPLDKKNVYIHGSPEDVHRMHAALLYLQKEGGSRYADLTFHFPEGMSIAKDKNNDEYISQHLGTLKEPPQLIQWRDFLKLELNTPKADIPVPIQPTSDDEPTTNEDSQGIENLPLIDMKRAFDSKVLSQQDKMLLNEYQRYLNEAWVNASKSLRDHAGDTGYLISKHEEFIQRTEAAIRVFKKDPDLIQECDVLTTLYTETLGAHQQMLYKLHQIELSYETQRKELMPQLNKANKEAMEECLHLVNQHLNTEMTLNVDLNESQRDNLDLHSKAIQTMQTNLQSHEELSDELYRSFGTQIGDTLHFLESISDYSRSAIFQQMKEYAKERSTVQSRIPKPNNDGLLQACNQVKQRLTQFKSELQSPASLDVSLSKELKQQLGWMAKKIATYADELETEKAKDKLYNLIDRLQQISTNSITTAKERDGLSQALNESFPHIENNLSLAKAFTEVNKQLNASHHTASIPNDRHSQQGLDR